MRIKEEEKQSLRKEILDFLKKSNVSYNLSEIARAVNRTPPTIVKYIDDLVKEGKVIIIDKKSMKLIRISKV